MEVVVLRADATPVAHRRVGRIVCRGDAPHVGYWNNPAATDDTLKSGWMYTGDMGSFDARGYLTLRDRSKDVVISGCSTSTHAKWRKCFSSTRKSRRPAWSARPTPNGVRWWWRSSSAQPKPTLFLDTHMLERIARFKRPKHYLFVDELPKNSYGKVLKRELRNRLT